MSQKKMEAYKYAKKNRKELEKKRKRKLIINWICGSVVALALIAGSVFLIYYTNVLKPKNDAAKAAAALSENSTPSEDTANDVMNILNNGQAGDATVVPADEAVPATDATVDEAAPSADAATDEAAPAADAATDEAADATVDGAAPAAE